FREQVMEAAVDALRNIASDTRTPEGLVRAVEAVYRSILAILPTSVATGGNVRNAMPAGGVASNLLQASSSQLSRPALAKVLTEVLEQFGSNIDPNSDQKQLLAAILHWIAELSLGSEAKPEFIDCYQKQITEVAPRVNLPSAQYSYL